MSNGKGDTRRPAAVTEKEVERRWKKTFGRPVQEVEEPPTVEELFRASARRMAEELDRKIMEVVRHG